MAKTTGPDEAAGPGRRSVSVSFAVNEEYARVRATVLEYAARHKISEGLAVRALVVGLMASTGRAESAAPVPPPPEPGKLLEAVAAVRRDVAEADEEGRRGLRRVREDIATAVRAILVTLGKYSADEVDAVLSQVFPGGPDGPDAD